MDWSPLKVNTAEYRFLRGLVSERAITSSTDLGAIVDKMAPKFVSRHVDILRALRFIVANEEAERNSPATKAELASLVKAIVTKGSSADDDELLLWAQATPQTQTNSPVVLGPAGKITKKPEEPKTGSQRLSDASQASARVMIGDPLKEALGNVVTLFESASVLADSFQGNLALDRGENTFETVRPLLRLIEGGRGEIIDAADILVSDEIVANNDQEIVAEASDIGSNLGEPVTPAQAALGSAALPTTPLTGLSGLLVR